MKIHDRPWPCVVLQQKHRSRRVADVLQGICHQKTEHLDADTLSLVLGSLLYFESQHVGFRVPAGMQVSDIEFKDRVPPLLRWDRESLWIGYPVYHREVKLLGGTCIAIMAPYRRVLSQLLQVLLSITSFEFLTVRGERFAAFLESTFGKQTVEPPRVSMGQFTHVQIRVKSAVLPLSTPSAGASIRDLHRIVLTGENIFRTRLYQRLRSGKADGNIYKLSGARVTLLYSDDGGLGVGTSVSQYGAFAFRPGLGGSNVDEFFRLLGFLAMHDLFSFGRSDPLQFHTEEVNDV